MSSSTTSIIEQIAWEGLFSLPFTLILGCVMALLLLWSLFREVNLLGGWAIGFAGLRLVAVATVLWMLLGPTLQTVRETKTPHTIALLVDDSGSMSTQDPDEPGQNVRWAASRVEEGQLAALAELDRASIALEATAKRWDDFALSLQQNRDPSIVLQQLEKAEESASRCKVHVQNCSKMDGTASDGRIKRILQELDLVHETLLPACRTPLQSATPDTMNQVASQIGDTVKAIRDHWRTTHIRERRLAADWVSHLVNSPLPSTSTGTRRDLVSGLLQHLEKNVVAEFSDTLRVQRYHFSDLLTQVNGAEWKDNLASAIDAKPKLTNLSVALEHIAQSASANSLAAAILITDGGHNVTGATSPHSIATSMSGLPIHVVPVGGNARIRDIVVQTVNAPSVVTHEDSILFSVTMTGFECAGEETELVVRQNGRVVDRRNVSFQHNRQDVRETFEVVADELGRHEFEFAIRPLEEESSEENNQALVPINVVTNQVKVLLADGRPRWEYRYLEHLFSRDDSVEFDHLLFEPRVAASGARRASRRMPTTADEYARYDVVLLGDLSPQQLDSRSQSALAEYARVRGGNVVVTAGQHYMPQAFKRQPLVSLLPVQKRRTSTDLQTPFTVQLTAEGLNNEALLITESRTENPGRWTEQFRKQPIYFVSDYHYAKPAAHTMIETVAFEDSRLLDAEKMAMLSWHQVGSGKVAFLAAPATYHLRHRGGDRMHHRFWGQMLRWLTSSRQRSESDVVKLMASRVRYRAGEPIAVTLRLSERTGEPIPDATITVLAVRDDTSVASVELAQDERIPGRYMGTFESLATGSYRLIPQGEEVSRLLELKNPVVATVPFEERKLLEVAALVNVVSATNVEMTDTTCNRALLREIAEATGGLVVPPTAVDEVLRISAVAPKVSESVKTQPLWNRWRYLWLVIGCVFIEWTVRKSKGLL